MADLEDPGRSATLGGFGGIDDAPIVQDENPIEHDRAEAIERLKRHAAPGGALSAEALADRVRRVYLARTRVGIEQVLADLPPDPPWSLAAGLPPPPGQAPAVVQGPRPRATPWRALRFVVGGLALLAGVGVVLVRSAPDDDEGEQATEVPEPVTTPDRPDSTLPPLVVPDVPPITEPPATTTVPVDAADLGGFGYVEPEFVVQKVGQDIAPGRYLSTPELSCYWERVEGFGGTLDDAIANGGSLSGKHVIVDVLASDAGLRSQGCDFRPYAAPAAPATTFGDGDWLVGSDVAAGTYRLTERLGAASMCAWERAADFTFGFDGVIDYAYPAVGGDVTVALQAGERFTSMTCGTWSRA